jgi:hypothetical protein
MADAVPVMKAPFGVAMVVVTPPVRVCPMVRLAASIPSAGEKEALMSPCFRPSLSWNSP